MFYRAIQKYGWENIKHEILERNLSYDEANKKEIEYIKLYNSLAPNGYNLTKGGDGTKGLIFTEEHLEKISNKVSQYDLDGKYIKTFNSTMDAYRETHVYNIGMCARGERGCAGGYQWRYTDNSEDIIPYKDSACKPIVKLDLYTKELLAVYDSIKEAKEEFGNITGASIDISAVCRGVRKSAKGFIWQYAEDYNNNIQKDTSKHKRPVYKISVKNNLIENTYESIHEAGRQEDIDFRKIYKACNNGNEINGYLWNYVPLDDL